MASISEKFVLDFAKIETLKFLPITHDTAMEEHNTGTN